MNRREFFKLAGIGTGGLLLASSVLGAVTQSEGQAVDRVAFAVDYALRHGARYADAHLGPCEIQGHGQSFEALHLLHDDLLGMRICVHDQWRQIVIRDLDESAIARNIDLALQPAPALQQPEHWISAQFDVSKRLAFQSSDLETAAHLQSAWLRYRSRPALPRHGRDILFCDMLITD